MLSANVSGFLCHANFVEEETCDARHPDKLKAKIETTTQGNCKFFIVVYFIYIYRHDIPS